MTIRDFFIACPSITGEHIDVRVRVTECLVQWKFYFEALGEKKKFVDERALEKAKHHTLEQAEWGAIMRSYCLGLFPEHEAVERDYAAAKAEEEAEMAEVQIKA